MSNYCLECSKRGLDCCREAHAKFLTLKDARRIADFLGEEIDSFALYGDLNEKDKEEYIYIHRHQSYYYDLTMRDGKLLQLREKSDGSCFFQAGDGRCRIYPVRPLICRTYPFWLADDGELIFDGCSSDCRIVPALSAVGFPYGFIIKDAEHFNENIKLPGENPAFHPTRPPVFRRRVHGHRTGFDRIILLQ